MRISILLLVSVFLVALIFSCNESEVLPQDEVVETTSVQKPNKPVNNHLKSITTKEDYLLLSNEDRKEKWLDKLNFILDDPNLNSTQESLINDLIAEINNFAEGEYEWNEAIKNIALDLVDEFTETDFLNTFSSLEENSLSSSTTPTCSWCATDLSSTSQAVGGGNKPKCNCRWSCGDPWASKTCTLKEDPECCEKTWWGCGFLGFQPCIGRDTL